MSPLRELAGQTFDVALRSSDGSVALTGKTVLHASGANTQIPRVGHFTRASRALHHHVARVFGHHEGVLSGLPALPPGTMRASASHAVTLRPSSAVTVPAMDLPPGSRRA
jgi:hypothetical protein